MKKSVFMCFLLFAPLIHTHAQPQKPLTEITVKAGIYHTTYLQYGQHLEGNTCQNVQQTFNSMLLNRGLIDFAILCAAFHSQGVKLNMEFTPYPNHLRTIEMTEKGVVDILVSSHWANSINSEYVYVSDPVVLHGEAEKGVYVDEHHPLLQTPINDIDLSQYIGITRKIWPHDWNAIAQLTDLQADIEHFPNVFGMLKAGRADFTLLAFSTRSGNAFVDPKINIKPIPGIKVVLHDSRNYIVSKKFPLAIEYMNILNAGIAALRKENTITKFYQKSGYINPKVKGWKIINTHPKGVIHATSPNKNNQKSFKITGQHGHAN